MNCSLKQCNIANNISIELHKSNHMFISFSFLPTSMSSLYLSKGASIMFLSWKVSDSKSNECPVVLEMRSQCLSFIALLAMSSRSGQVSLKSSIFFFRSLKACQSFSALGSLRHLKYVSCFLSSVEYKKNVIVEGNMHFEQPDICAQGYTCTLTSYYHLPLPLISLFSQGGKC